MCYYAVKGVYNLIINAEGHLLFSYLEEDGLTDASNNKCDECVPMTKRFNKQNIEITDFQLTYKSREQTYPHVTRLFFYWMAGMR